MSDTEKALTIKDALVETYNTGMNVAAAAMKQNLGADAEKALMGAAKFSENIATYGAGVAVTIGTRSC